MRGPALLLFSIAASLTLAVASLPAAAQDPAPTPVGPGRTPEWRCVTPAGTCVVALRSMVSVSTHEYLLNATARVTELNIDTMGNALIRFYYIEPLTPKDPLSAVDTALQHAQETAEQVTSQAGQEPVWKKVVKSYPATTHSHTIEYRVDSKAKLQKIFESADTALRDFKDTEYKIQ